MSLQFEITTDRQLLKQYFLIRERCFREELGLSGFDGSEDGWDRRSSILVAREGATVVGGMRITGRHPHLPQLLPIEDEGLTLQQVLPQLELSHHAYCQWSRLAILPDYRTTGTLRQFCAEMIDTSRELGYAFSFLVAGMNRSRLYKRLYSVLGYGYEILDGVKIPIEEGFNGLPHLLSVGYLDPDQARATPANLILPQVA